MGWCMNGEMYRRDRDCDGDGHYDHECNSEDEKGAWSGGFISSADKCTDTWPKQKCQPHAAAMQPFKFVKIAGRQCVEHNTPSCYKSHEGWPSIDYSRFDSCKLQVQWTQSPIQPSTADCHNDLPEEKLYVEIMSLGVERADFTTSGLLRYGDRLQVGPVNVLSGNFSNLYSADDKTEVTWQADRNVESEGWLICLRVKRRIPHLYKATCDELGVDLYTKLDISDRQSVRIQCEECIWKPTTALFIYVDTFALTRPICDAGWQVRGKSNFLFTYRAAWNTEEPRFYISH